MLYLERQNINILQLASSAPKLHGSKLKYERAILQPQKQKQNQKKVPTMTYAIETKLQIILINI